LGNVLSDFEVPSTLVFPSFRGRAADLMCTKLPGTLKPDKTFSTLAPYEYKLCFQPAIFCVKHVLDGV
jgi:hypothetical protein